MHKQLFIILGFICVALGVLGIFLPVLPTTPFLLLAAWLFAKSSDKLYNKLLENKYVGSYIKNFREHRSIPMPTKILAISMIWVSIGISVVFAVKMLWVKIVCAHRGAPSPIVNAHARVWKAPRPPGTGGGIHGPSR